MNKLDDIIINTNSLNVLYVEDNMTTLEVTKHLFQDIFTNIITANDGNDGLNKFKNNKFDLIVTDINLPNLNGIELIEQIRQANKNIPILVLSAYSESKYFMDCIKLGIDGYLLKPIDTEQLFILLEKITEKLQTQEKLENQILLSNQYLEIINASSIVSKTDTNGIITYVNDNFCNVTGYTKEELLGKNHNIIKDTDSKIEVFQEMWETIQNKKIWNGIRKNSNKYGESYYVNASIKPILDKNNNIIEYLSVQNNISNIISDKQHFKDRIEQNELSILILIQINEYNTLEKFYNTSLLDKLEKKFSYNLLTHLPEQYKFENVYNLDNGRFALLTNYHNFEQRDININNYLEVFIQNIKNTIIEIDSIKFDLNISLSYSMGKHLIYEDAKAGLEEIINKNITLCRSNDLSIIYQEEARNNMKIIKMLKIALDNYNVVSFFQPIINNNTMKVEKYESLVRVIDQEGKILTPYHFLSISKKSRYYNKITMRVLENSFKMLSKIKHNLSINLSTLDIEKNETREKIFELLKEYKNSRKRLVFELLEDEEAKNFKTIKKFIKDVKSLGVSIAIDDFGAGYSNFERLLEFEPDILKIDGSLIKDIETNQYSLSVVKTIVAFAKEQKIKTIAEFVENENIFNILKKLGVDYSQGYFFGKPEPLKASNK